MAHRTTLIPGDGTRPAITEASVQALEATGVQFNRDVKQAGTGGAEEYGLVSPGHVLESIRLSKVAIKGPISTPPGGGFERGDPAIAQISELYEQGRISEDADLPLKTMSGRSNRPCAETRSRERQ